MKKSWKFGPILDKTNKRSKVLIMSYYVGVDLGGTNIVAAVVTDDYKILAKSSTPTNAPRKPEEIFDDIAKVVFESVEKSNLTMDDIEWVGMGTPGTVNQKNGYIEFANNLKFDNVPARDMLVERLKTKVYLENDANCAALGEALAGCGHGAPNFVAVTLGTGVGSGVIINSNIITGVNFAGGECGHMVIVKDGEPCSCGRNGCWEAYASATALIRQTKDAMEKNPNSLMHQVAEKEGKVSGRTAFDAMRLGDETAKEVCDKYIEYVACGVTNLINAMQPEILCIGGGICNEGETIMKPIREYVAKERYSIHSSLQTKIVRAELGNDAGVIGAALLGNVKRIGIDE